MPKKLTNTAARANGQGSKAASMSAKSPGFPGKLGNTASRSTAKGSGKSPAAFGKLGTNTMKAVKPSGSKKGY